MAEVARILHNASMRERYIQLLKTLLAPTATVGHQPSAAHAENAGDPSPPPGVLPISLAAPWTERILGDSAVRLDPIIQTPADVGDAHQHRRPAYRGLFIYAARQADPTLDLSAWVTLFQSSLDAARWQLPPTAARGAEATGLAWDALALGSLTEWARVAPMFAQLREHQLPTGQLLATTPSDNPETHWFHELVLLHAAASYAGRTNDEALRQTTLRAAEYHQDETQPDHATTQPWALLPMIQNPHTHPLADQLLHATTTQHPTTLAGVPQLLLTDTLTLL